MSKQSGGLGLPRYRATERQKKWLAGKKRTAQLIQSLWRAASNTQRKQPAFLSLLTQCGWTNVGNKGKGRESTRRWRNRNIAEDLHVPYQSDAELATALHKKLPHLTQGEAARLIASETGITHYYKAFRRATVRFIKVNSSLVHTAFRRVSTDTSQIERKISGVGRLVERLGDVRAANRKIAAFNGLTPVLACLDPNRRFPIMNDRTRSLLRVIRAQPDANGVVALYKLIGLYNVKNSFELDAYAFGEDFSGVKKVPARSSTRTDFKDIGLKSEINSIANISAKSTKIKKRHNRLINRLGDALLWRKIVEFRFDALVRNWKDGRHLLIEAKTESEETAGRTQIRQAIGQLYDYRFTHFPGEKIDLAILLPKRPKEDKLSLLASLHIAVLWFEGKKLSGTIRL